MRGRLAAHFRRGLHGDLGEAALGQCVGVVAGARADVGQQSARRQVQQADQAIDDALIRRPVGVVVAADNVVERHLTSAENSRMPDHSNRDDT